MSYKDTSNTPPSTSQKECSLETDSIRTLIWDFPLPEVWENKFLLLKSPSPRYLIMAALADS